jgi:hypothetical protein
MPEPSDTLISSLQKRIDDLTTDNATIRAEAKNRRLKGKTLSEELDAARAQIVTLTSERDGLMTAAKAQPHELQAQVDEYRAKLRDRDHRDKFKQLATAAGVTQDKALDDLWSLSGYRPEQDAIDETKITAAITSTLSGRDWLKAAPALVDANGQPTEAGKAAAEAAANATRSPGPGANRGTEAGNNDREAALEAKYPNAFRIA